MQRVLRDPDTRQNVFTDLEGKVSLVRQHFPPSIASLYALPRLGSDGVLEWWSELGGQPLRYHDLKPDDQERLKAKLAQQQNSVAHLADTLKERGEESSALTLRYLVSNPDLSNLFSLNGVPLLVRWGIEPPVEIPVLVPGAVKRGQTLWPWLLGALLLALLIALLLWLWMSRDYLMGLLPRHEIATYACQKDPKALPPEFVVVLDTSGSMGFNVDISSEDEDWFLKVGQKLPATNPRVKRLFSGLARIDVAKQSFANMIRDLHPEIDIRLITFGDCNAQVDHGIFDLAQRPALVSGINGLEAYGGTPLASSLEEAANQVDGRERDAVIVMFIDGEEGCDRDVCEVSKRIAREQPRLRVNVVNISTNSNPSCISENTGGRIYTAENSEQISSLLRDAAKEVSNSDVCSPKLN